MKTFIKAKIVGDGIDPKEYHRQDFKRGDLRFVMSRSELMDFASCPSRWINGHHEEEDTESTEWGSLFDCLVTDADRFDDRFAVKPASYTSEKGEEKAWRSNAKVCEAWEAEHEGKTLIKNERFQGVNKAINRLHKDSELHEILCCSKKQVMATAVYKDAFTELEIVVKILLDLVPDAEHPKFGKTLADVKTCRDASLENFKWQAFKLGYHVQAALYMDVYAAAMPEEDRQDWRLVLSENVAPFEPARRWIDSEMIHLGRATYQHALARYCLCLKTNSWPSFDDQDNQMIPGWSQISPEPRMINA